MIRGVVLCDDHGFDPPAHPRHPGDGGDIQICSARPATTASCAHVLARGRWRGAGDVLRSTSTCLGRGSGSSMSCTRCKRKARGHPAPDRLDVPEDRHPRAGARARAAVGGVAAPYYGTRPATRPSRCRPKRTVAQGRSPDARDRTGCWPRARIGAGARAGPSEAVRPVNCRPW